MLFRSRSTEYFHIDIRISQHIQEPQGCINIRTLCIHHKYIIIPIDRIPTLLVQLLPFHEDRLIAGVTP